MICTIDVCKHVKDLSVIANIIAFKYSLIIWTYIILLVSMQGGTGISSKEKNRKENFQN